MKQVELVFPNEVSMTRFILSQRIAHVETDIENCYLKAVLTDDLVAIAEAKYSATILFMSLTQIEA
jgi:hypothetical protein